MCINSLQFAKNQIPKIWIHGQGRATPSRNKAYKHLRSKMAGLGSSVYTIVQRPQHRTPQHSAEDAPITTSRNDTRSATSYLYHTSASRTCALFHMIHRLYYNYTWEKNPLPLRKFESKMCDAATCVAPLYSALSCELRLDDVWSSLRRHRTPYCVLCGSTQGREYRARCSEAAFPPGRAM